MKMRVCADGQRGGRCRVIGDLFRSFAHAFAGRSMLPSLSHQSRCFGVGLSEAQRNRTKYFYDANGDVGQLVDSTLTTASIQAKYEYYPFGGILVSTGTYALINPFKSWTKYRDNEASLVYFGYRYLRTQFGRWISRDPLGEDAGLDLYEAFSNDSTNRLDPLGLCCGLPTPEDPSTTKPSPDTEPDPEQKKVCEAKRKALLDSLRDHEGLIGRLKDCAYKQGCISTNKLEDLIQCKYDCPNGYGGWYTDGAVYLCGNNLKKGDPAWEIIAHELVHAAQCKMTFDANDKCMSKMIGEARAYWSTRQGCTCQAACERAWSSARSDCYDFLVGGGGKDGQSSDPKAPKPTRDEFEKANKDKYIKACKALCGKKGYLHDAKQIDDVDCAAIVGGK